MPPGTGCCANMDRREASIKSFSLRQGTIIDTAAVTPFTNSGLVYN
jgi:hypothetical protein